MEYCDYIIEMRGFIVEIDDCSVAIEFKGRLGKLHVPLRMLITSYPLKIGQEVSFRMSFPEVLFEEPNPKYLENIRLKEDYESTIKKGEDLCR